MNKEQINTELDKAILHINNAKALVNGNGSNEIITDREPHILPDLPSINKGEVITDPVFGSRIVRVTDNNTNVDVEVSFRSSDSSVQRSWNSTNDRFIIEDTYGQQLVYEFNNLKTKKIRTLPFGVRRRRRMRLSEHLIIPFNGSDCSFHDINRDLVYGRYGNKIIKVYNLADNTFTTVIDLDTLGLNLPEESYTGGVIVMNDTLLTTCGGASQDYNHHVVIVPLDGGEIRTLDTKSLVQFNDGEGFYLHGTSLDISGQYVLMQPSNLSNDPGHLYVWNLDTNSIVMVDVCTSGHLSVGNGYWVNQDCAPNSAWDAAQWVIRKFSSPNEVRNLIEPLLTPKEVYLADHSSWTNMMSPNTGFVSATYRYLAEDVEWRAWDNEVIVIVPSSGVVKRYAHHRSEVIKSDGSFDYWATPRPNISNDGKYAMFTSNWGRSLGIDGVEGGNRQDVFIVELR